MNESFYFDEISEPRDLLVRKNNQKCKLPGTKQKQERQGMACKTDCQIYHSTQKENSAVKLFRIKLLWVCSVPLETGFNILFCLVT